LLNSPSKEVFEASVRDLDYHVKLFEAMGLEDYKYKLVMHIGGLYKTNKRLLKGLKKTMPSSLTESEKG